MDLTYASVAPVATALPAGTALPEPSGFLVPATEGTPVKAATFTTRTWPGRGDRPGLARPDRPDHSERGGGHGLPRLVCTAARAGQDHGGYQLLAFPIPAFPGLGASSSLVRAAGIEEAP